MEMILLFFKDGTSACAIVGREACGTVSGSADPRTAAVWQDHTGPAFPARNVLRPGETVRLPGLCRGCGTGSESPGGASDFGRGSGHSPALLSPAVCHRSEARTGRPILPAWLGQSRAGPPSL